MGDKQILEASEMPVSKAFVPHLRYGSYVVRHKWFVLVAGLRTRAPLWRLIIHDWSKLTRLEWGAYVRSFYGPQPRTDAVKAAFDAAWLHHQHANPHHWQHWVLREDSGATKVLSMPEKFIREMVADWMGAGRAITGRWEVATWYDANRDKILLADDTRDRVESLIGGLDTAALPPPSSAPDVASPNHAVTTDEETT